MADGLLHTHKVDEVETPFLLRVFYRVGAFYRSVLSEGSSKVAGNRY